MEKNSVPKMENGINPYVGPRPFERKERDLFFGRDLESIHIISLILSNPLVLIYSQSGAGKTSLFNTKITYELEQEYKFRTFPSARVRSLLPAGKIPENVDNMYMFNILQSLKPDADPEILKKQSLSSFLNRHLTKTNAEAPHPSLNQDSSSNDTPRIIVFDQLEELFGLYPENWHQQRQEFFRQVAEALNEDNMLRIVFIIREEYLAHISSFAHLLPGRLRARFRIERLRKDAAFEAVKGPLEKAKTAANISKLIDKLFDDGIIDNLIEDLLKIRVETFGGKFREAKGEFVEPIQLQVVCQRLWIKLMKSQTDQINQADFEYLEDVDEALEAFYVDAIDEVSKQTEVKEDTIRRCLKKILLPLVEQEVWYIEDLNRLVAFLILQ